MDIGGGHSKSIMHPEHGLVCPETSTLPVVVKFKVYVGGTGFADEMLPAKAADTGVTMDTILLQPCFATSEESCMFLSFTDGDIVGGRFPSQGVDQPLHRGWSGAEYFIVTEGSTYKVGDQSGRGVVNINLAMAKSAVVKVKLQAALAARSSQNPRLAKAAEEEIASMCGAVVKDPDVLLRGLAVDGARAIEAEVIPGDIIQLYGVVTTTTVSYTRS